jgi:hypothetical protein
MTKTAYVLEGKLGAPVLLVANSLGANYSMWDPQIAEWKKNFQVLRYNYRGHGGTTSVGNFATSQDLADDVVGPLITQTINFTSGVPGQDSSIAGRLAISDTLTVNGISIGNISVRCLCIKSIIIIIIITIKFCSIFLRSDKFHHHL